MAVQGMRESRLSRLQRMQNGILLPSTVGSFEYYLFACTFLPQYNANFSPPSGMCRCVRRKIFLLTNEIPLMYIQDTIEQENKLARIYCL